MTIRHEAQVSGPSERREARPNLRRGNDAIIGGVLVLALVVITVVVQQMVFYEFVQQNGGRPRGLFDGSDGQHYKLWSFTVPTVDVDDIAHGGRHRMGSPPEKARRLVVCRRRLDRLRRHPLVSRRSFERPCRSP